MREAIAGFFAVIVVVPMLIVSQFGFASRSWLLDGDFYRSITADERLYQGWESGASHALTRGAAEEGFILDAEAARAALDKTFTDAELARLVSSFAGGTVDRLRELPLGTDSSIDLSELKRDVRGRLEVFASSYAAALPTGLPSSDRDLSVRPASVDDALWAAGLSKNLSTALDSAPDEVPVSTPPMAGNRLPAFRSGTTLGAAVNRSLLSMGGFAVLIWFTCSMAARSRWRDRFIWLGSTLGFASFFPIAAGAVMLLCASPLAQSGSTFVAERLSGMVAEAFRAAGNDAERIASVLAQAFTRVGRSFFLTGLVGAAFAAALSSARFFALEDERDEDSDGRP